MRHQLKLLTTILFSMLAGTAAAQEGPDTPGPETGAAPSVMSGLGESSVDRHQGEFHQAIPIEVPPFHGIEPKLSLRYSSQNGNGLLGIGWSLSGISQIVRVGPRHSAPTYNPTKDTFVLDGIDLVPCAQAAVSPSCRSGGNYATMMESYARIDRTSVNRFVVTTRDGTRAIYGPVNTTDRGVLRWGVTQVIDTHGNVVDYNWALSTGRDAYPTSIRYNGNIINFFREHRPDQETFATGSGLGQAAHRLKTIDVRVGLAHCARLRAPLRVHRARSPVQAGVRAHVRHGRDPGP